MAWTRLLSFPLLTALLIGPARGALVDRDHDGIPDDWETNGVMVTFADGTTRFLDLAGQGASTSRRDVIVWINWLEADDHSHKPVPRTEAGPDGQHALEAQALDGLRAAFRKQGMNLIVFYSEHAPIHETPELRVIGASAADGSYDWKPLDDLIDGDLPVSPARIREAMHICTFIHKMGGPAYGRTGLSKSIPGHEFVVSLARDDSATGSANEQEGTFMHELGHNLGLQHGGGDPTMYKPNYLSVMNYFFQATGLQKDGMFGNFDYSPKAIPFDERAVNGSLGVSTDPSIRNWGYAQVCDVLLQKYKYFPTLDTPNKWDCTDTPPHSGSLPIDVNKDGCIEPLAGFNDWANLTLTMNSAEGGFLPVRIPRPSEELQVSQLLNIYAGLRVAAVKVVRQQGGNLVSWARLPLESVVGYEVTRMAPGERPIIIRKTSRAQFIDVKALPDIEYTYQVRAVVSGFAEDAIQRAVTQLSGIASIAADAIKPVLALRRPISPTLMLTQPSAPVSSGQ